jgi:glycosyltransferase involved in cell wall biosynthesis
VTGQAGGRLGDGRDRPRPAGVRVVLDVRPLQAPDRAPLAAAYLEGLLGAFAADPLAGESFAFLLASDLDDPTTRFSGLDVVGRRQLPPTRLLRSGAMTVDPFVLRGAAVGATWRAERGGAAGAVYHAVGGGPLPIASGLPVVVTLLDLAPWELPEAFQRSLASRFGQRLRAQLLREAAAVIVGSTATAVAARRLIRIRRDRLRVVPLAPRAGFAPWPVGAAAGASPSASSDVRARLGLTGRYLVFTGRFDARLDLATLLSALAQLARADRPADLEPSASWPPRVLLVGATPDDRASIARAAARKSVGDALVYAPGLPVADLVELVRGARAVVLPVVSEAAGLPVIEAIACGTPVIASAVGPLPELIGPAGLLVEPGDPDRLAVALATLWSDDAVHARIAASARERAAWNTRTWADVARETREVYAAVGSRPAAGA